MGHATRAPAVRPGRHHHGTGPTWIVRITIGSFSLAALIGIVALLGGGDFGETEGRVLLTTLLVGVVSIAVLCYLATAGRQVAAGGSGRRDRCCCRSSPGSDDLGWRERAGRRTGEDIRGGAIVAATLAQVCLLLAPGEKAGIWHDGCCSARSGSPVSLRDDEHAGAGVHPRDDSFYRALGLVAILDVLGTVVGAALMKFGPTRRPEEAGADRRPAAGRSPWRTGSDRAARRRRVGPASIVAEQPWTATWEKHGEPALAGPGRGREGADLGVEAQAGRSRARSHRLRRPPCGRPGPATTG